MFCRGGGIDSGGSSTIHRDGFFTGDSYGTGATELDWKVKDSKNDVLWV